MLLKEFFNNQLTFNNKEKDFNDKPTDDLFWFILDNDKLHKDYFFNAANKIRKSKDISDVEIKEMFMPMVIKGCKEYFLEKKLEGRLSHLFPDKMREEICKRLYEHFKEDIKKGVYRLN